MIKSGFVILTGFLVVAYGPMDAFAYTCPQKPPSDARISNVAPSYITSGTIAAQKQFYDNVLSPESHYERGRNTPEIYCPTVDGNEPRDGDTYKTLKDLADDDAAAANTP